MAKVSHLFIDTNILLHFRPISEIPWNTLVQGSRIELIITQGIIRDLDKHKNTNSSMKIRARARRALNEIEAWAANATGFEVQPNLVVKIHAGIPTIDFTEYNLDRNWSDDYLLATIKSFPRASSEDLVWIVSDDTGIRIKAKQLGIDPLVLDDAYRLPQEKDPLKVENERLKREVLKLSTPFRPDLKIEFLDSKDFVRFQLPAVPNEQEVEHELSAKLEVLKKKYGPRTEDTLARLHLTLEVPSKQEIEKYNTALPKYYSAYEQYLRQISLNEIRRLLTFKFTLRQIGRAHV